MASIETRASPTGRTVHRVKIRIDKRQISRTFDNEKGAHAFLALAKVNPRQALAMLDQPEDAAPPVTVVELVTAHIDQLTGVENGTRSTYRGYLKRDIEPDRIGALLARDVTRADVAAWVNRLEDQGMAGKTIANRKGLLSGAFSTAVRDNTLTANPVRGTRVPRSATPPMRLLTPPEFAALHDACPEHYRLVLLTLVGTGMRFGEATALQVHDLDPLGASLTIRQAWKYTDGKGHRLGPPKTSAGGRTVAVPVLVAQQLAQVARGRKDTDFLLTTPRGHVIRRDIFRRDAWMHAVTALDRKPRVHDLRHTYASWAIQSGTPLPVIQRQLGHQSITTTVDTYGGLVRADFDAMAARIALRLPGAEGSLVGGDASLQQVAR